MLLLLLIQAKRSNRQMMIFSCCLRVLESNLIITPQSIASASEIAVRFKIKISDSPQSGLLHPSNK